MRKFRLLKFYPSLNRDWKEGLVVIKDSDDFYRPANIINSPGRIIASFVEDYPEFWEEIIEKDYEILEIHYNNPKVRQNIIISYENDICTECKKTDGTKINYLNIVKLSQCIPEDWKYITILKIRRKSDGVEFKLGDKVYNPNCKSQTFIIESFYLDCNNIHLLCGKGHINITKIEHYKEPILITEDRVKLYQYDNFYFVDTMFNLGKGVLGANIHNPIKGYKHFSTKEAANKYIYKNKPEFSRKQILDVISKIGINEPYLFGFRYDKPVICVDVFKQNLKL